MAEPFAYIYKRCECCKLSVHEYQFPFKAGSKKVRLYDRCLFCVDQCVPGQRCKVRPLVMKKKAK